MTELEKIEYAKGFIDKLANGINPIDDTPVPDGDVVNNVRLSRCFFYVSEILRQVVENGGVTSAKPKKVSKKAFSLTKEQRAGLAVSKTPLSVSEIVKYLNEAVDLEVTKKLASTAVTEWLVDIGFLEVVELPNGKKKKRPAAAGKDIGIFEEERNGMYGIYVVVLYNEQAQQFIYDNIEAIIDFKAEKEDRLAEFHNRPWTEENDLLLCELYKKGDSLSEIADALKRTVSIVRKRIKHLGL